MLDKETVKERKICRKYALKIWENKTKWRKKERKKEGGRKEEESKMIS